MKSAQEEIANLKKELEGTSLDVLMPSTSIVAIGKKEPVLEEEKKELVEDDIAQKRKDTILSKV